jgi:hypothetical protein
MDPDYFATYMAVDDAILNVDGLTAFYVSDDASWTGNHNYYFYEEETRPFFWLIPWDLDSTLSPGVFGAVPHWTTKPADCSTQYPVWSGGDQVFAPGCDPLLSALASNLDGYRSAVARLLDGPFDVAELERQIDEHAEFIREGVRADPVGPTEAGWEASIHKLKSDLPLLRERVSRLAAGQSVEPFILSTTAPNDFETTETFNLRLDAMLLTNPNSSADVVINEDGAISGGRDVRLSFQYRNEASAWNQWLLFSLGLEGGTADVRPFTGVRFRAKADRARTLRVNVESPKQTAQDAGVMFGWDVPLGPTAASVEVQFANASVQSWAVDQGLDPHDDLDAVLATVTALAFNVSCVGLDASGFLPQGTTDEGAVELDDLEFF